MGISSGPRIVTDGLILNISPSSEKNYKVHSTNFFTNGSFSGGTGIPQESGSGGTNEIVQLSNPGDSDYVLRQSNTVLGGEYQINLTTQLAASTTYVMSGWYAKSLDYNGADTMFHSRAHSTSGAHNALGTGIGTTLYSKVVDGILWRYCYTTITTPADYDSAGAGFNWYVGYGTTNTAGYRYYTNLKMERGNFPSLYDHSGSGNHHNYTGNVSYSNGQFTTDGVNASGYSRFAALTGATTSNTVVVFYKTTDGAELWVRGNSSNGTYLSASSSNNYYHGGAGTPTNYVDLALTTRPDTPINYRNGNYHMWEAKNVNFSSWTTFEWFQYPGTWLLNGTVSNILVYNRSITADESKQNFYALKSRYGI